MWPEPGSGFEADPFSPAGTAQREGQFLQGLARRRGGRIALWTLAGTVMVVPLAYLVTVIVHRL